MPINIPKATNWARRVFEEWRDNRSKSSKEKCPSTLLRNPDFGVLNYWLAPFMVEVWKADGEPYLASSIVKRILTMPCGLLVHQHFLVLAYQKSSFLMFRTGYCPVVTGYNTLSASLEVWLPFATYNSIKLPAEWILIQVFQTLSHLIVWKWSSIVLFMTMFVLSVVHIYTIHEML